MSKLKKCPFCHGKANVEVFGKLVSYVECVICEAAINRPTKKQAIAAWNRRDEPPKEGSEHGMDKR